MSIITEALKKAENERNKVIGSKEYLNRILDSPLNTSSVRSDAGASAGAADSANRQPHRPLLVFGILVVGVIVFLSAINMLIISAPDTKEAASKEAALPAKNAIEAEAYTTAMQSDINSIEQRAAILDNTGAVLKGRSVTDEFISNFTLNGIIYDTDNSWAIINNKMVKTGDVLSGAQIVSILPQKVILVFKKETFDLTVK